MSLPAGYSFAGDDGTADPSVLAALADPDERALMAALATARVLLPVVPLPAGEHDHDHDHDHGSVAPIATVSLVAPDGRRGMLAFSGVEALAAWDPASRPLPAVTREAARAALDGNFDAIVVDPRSGHERVLRPSMMWALLTGRDWLPAHLDPVVLAALSAAVGRESDVQAVTPDEGAPGAGTLLVRLGVAAGLTEGEVADLVTRIGQRLAADPDVRVRLDDVAFSLRPAGPPRN
ncbi:MAG TPA: SseB family protein [Dermatophilaceae bacterium]|nr:SseB family protein [Dermatophilaceae bacterium]